MSEKTCPTCQQKIDQSADFCPHCEQEFCPECHAPLEANATQCQQCGVEFALLCPRCNYELTAVDTDNCPACGYALTDTAVEIEVEIDTSPRLINTRATLARATVAHALSGAGGLDDDEEAIVDCPVCGEPAYVDEAYCENCENAFCPHCIQAINEDDETCPHCGTLLYFDCPNCHFELTTGTQICPNCNVLFLPYCLECNTAVEPLDQDCPECGAELPLEVRDVARVVHTLVSGRQIVYVFACSNCGTQFDSLRSDCPSCGTRICSQCQLILKKGEEVCPRCRPDVTTAPCPQCKNILPKGLDECPYCQQLLCPECGTAVGENDVVCTTCGTEFELLCPNCEAVISAADETCPACQYEFNLS